MLDSKGAEFHWADGYPFLGMSQVIKLLKSIQLITEDDYEKKFIKAVGYRNRVAHQMYAQWAQDLATLAAWADLVIECVQLIVTRSKLQPK